MEATGGNETRPRNLAVMWCIKAWNAPINQGNIDVAALVTFASQATETNQGTAKIASDAQMLDSVNDAVIVTPKKLRFGFSISLAANGYIAFPTWLGGLIVQWGLASATVLDGRVTVPFPLAFPTACRSLVAVPINPDVDGNIDSGPQIVSISSPSFNAYIQNYVGGVGVPKGFYWHAIGH